MTRSATVLIGRESHGHCTATAARATVVSGAIGPLLGTSRHVRRVGLVRRTVKARCETPARCAPFGTARSARLAHRPSCPRSSAWTLRRCPPAFSCAAGGTRREGGTTMGDYADAAIECFGPRLRDRLVPLLSPFRYELIEEPDHLIATIENLACGGEELLCDRLRELLIPHEFLHAGDHETEPRLRLFHPEVPEAYGHEAALGEWRGAASANGEALAASSSLDRILAEMPEDADDVWLREQLEIASAARWRALFADLRGRPNTSRPRLVTRRLVDE